MEINNMEQLLEGQLQSLFDIESQLIEAIPLLIDSASSEGLKEALRKHLEVTEKQRERLVEIGEERGIELTGKKDKGLRHILTDAQRLVNRIGDPQLKDTAIMGGTEKVEHYEMAAYQSAKTIARKLDDQISASKLEETYQEEKQAAESINLMAEGGWAGKISQTMF